MGRLILHIGTHKTATTSIQRALARDRKALAAAGIWYPGYDVIGRASHYAHLGIVNALSGHHDLFSPEDAERFFRIVRERSADFDATILSAEPLYRHVHPETTPPSSLGPKRYWSRRKDYIARIAELAGPSAEIAVVFRRQADYAESLHQEHVKATEYRKPFRAFLREFWFHFDYLGQTEAWAGAFGRIAPVRFSDLAQSGNPARAFLERLGLDGAGLSGSEPPRNARMPADAVILKRMLNGGGRGREMRGAVERLLRLVPPETLAELGRRSFFEDAEALLAYQAGFDANNAALKARFFGPDAPEEPLFPPLSEAGRTYGDALHPAMLAAVIELASRRRGPESPARRRLGLRGLAAAAGLSPRQRPSKDRSPEDGAEG